MRQFMGDEPLPCFGSRFVLAGCKRHVAAHCVCCGIDGLGRLLGFFIGVNPDLAEIMSKARLQKGSRTWVERLARRAQHVMNDGGNAGWRSPTGRKALQSHLLFLALLAFTIRAP